MSENALVPIEQKTVLFYEDEITAVLVDENGRQVVYVPIRPICSRLGVAWPAQRQRILRDAVLADEMTPVIVTITGTGQQVESLCLPLDYLGGFLFGINASRVKPEIKERLIRYQRECFKVLAEAFQEGRLTADPDFASLLERDTDAVQAYKTALAIVKLARNQVMLEAKVEMQVERLDAYEQRLETLESQIGSGETITLDQATAISQAVKTVAVELGKKSRRNEFGGVYGELYRRYRIPSYRELPKTKYNDAIKWLGEWLQSLTADEPF